MNPNAPTQKTAKWLSMTFKQISAIRYERSGEVQISDDRIKPAHHALLPSFFYLARPVRLDGDPLAPLDVIDGESSAYPLYAELHRGSYHNVLTGVLVTYNACKKNRSTLVVEIEGAICRVVVFPYRSANTYSVMLLLAELRRHPNNPLKLASRTGRYGSTSTT